MNGLHPKRRRRLHPTPIRFTLRRRNGVPSARHPHQPRDATRNTLPPFPVLEAHEQPPDPRSVSWKQAPWGTPRLHPAIFSRAFAVEGVLVMS
jgi:hypothetical protein